MTHTTSLDVGVCVCVCACVRVWTVRRLWCSNSAVWIVFISALGCLLSQLHQILHIGRRRTAIGAAMALVVICWRMTD